jgi:hypothetical protein
MAKSLSARIAERIARKKPAGNVRNRAAFLALRGEVKQAIDDGWPVKTIWETLHDEEKVAFSYQAFRGYVNRLILSPPANGEERRRRWWPISPGRRPRGRPRSQPGRRPNGNQRSWPRPASHSTEHRRRRILL